MIKPHHSVLVMVLMLLVFPCCKPRVHNWNVALTGGYNLTYHEWVPDDAFMIVDKNNKVVIPPQIMKVANDSQFIWGAVEPNGDKIFDPIAAGFFVINISTGAIEAGLDEHQFAANYTSLSLSDLKPSASFWKPQPGVYQPHQH
jgi:hypothetical protein